MTEKIYALIKGIEPRQITVESTGKFRLSKSFIEKYGRKYDRYELKGCIVLVKKD
jgi:hypothetical protein